MSNIRLWTMGSLCPVKPMKRICRPSSPPQGLRWLRPRRTAVGAFHPQVLVNLHENDVVRLQPLERFVYLKGSGLPAASIDLGHEKDLCRYPSHRALPIHTSLFAVVVVPAVVHEGDASVNG